jgi:propionate CoA-transferase
VFRRGPEGLELIEVAPGVDLEEHVLARMGARVRVAPDLRPMDERIFRDEPMGLGADLAARPARTRRRSAERAAAEPAAPGAAGQPAPEAAEATR